MSGAIALPATARQDLASGFDLEKPRFIPCVLARAKTSGPQMHCERLRVALFEDAMRNERPDFEIASYLLKQSRDGGFIMRHLIGINRALTLVRRLKRNDDIDGLLLCVRFSCHVYFWAGAAGRALHQTNHEFPQTFLPEIINV